MAFLALGGERLIYDAVELAAKVPARYGEPLTEVLGSDATLAVLRFALHTTAQGMLGGKSQLLIRDELRVEVLRHVQATHRRLLDAGAEHASLIVETAQALHSALVRRLAHPTVLPISSARRSRPQRWEHRADEILVGLRQTARRVDHGETIVELITIADDAIDALEEAVFLLTLLPDEAVGVVEPVLDSIANLAVATAREHLKAVEIAREVVEGSGPEDLEDFLIAVDRVVSLEHDADRADRARREPPLLSTRPISGASSSRTACRAAPKKPPTRCCARPSASATTSSTSVTPMTDLPFAPVDADAGLFVIGNTDVRAVSPESVGSKAYNLMRMADASLAVPPGFVLGTQRVRRVPRTGWPARP